MAQGAGPSIGLADRLHRDRRLHPGADAAALQLVLHGQRIYYGGEHAHVVTRRALHADRRARQASEDVAAADHQAQLDAEGMDGLDLLGDTRDHRRVEPVIALAHQRFARDFEKDATILQIGRHASRAYPAEWPAIAGGPKITP